MKRISIATAAALFLMILSLKAAEVTEKKEAAPNGNEMPLELYQKLKGHFDALYGAKAGLLPGVQPQDKGEAEKALKTDAAASKAVLIKSLGSSQVIQRELAARALEYCGDKTAAVEALCKIVADDPEESVRRAAATALAKLPDAAAQDALQKSLFDSVETVRALSARALGNIKDSHSSGALLKALNSDVAPMVRMQIAMALKKIKDPNTLDRLKQALDNEKDENVKIAIAGAIRELIGDSAETADVPTADQAGGTLTKLAEDMKAVEEKLRSDRHDQAVQADGANIEKQLTELIKKLEKSSSSSSKSKSEQEKEQQQQQKQANGQDKKDAKQGMQDSKLGANVPAGATNAAMVSGTMDAWAKLPPAQRDELLQAFREDVPERWRTRLEAYFLSVNAEQNKDADK